MTQHLPLHTECGLFFDDDLAMTLKPEPHHEQDTQPPLSCVYNYQGECDDDEDEISRLFMVTPPSQRQQQESTTTASSPVDSPSSSSVLQTPQLQQQVALRCDQCGFQCYGSESLRAHTAAHLFSERPYACTDCNKRFREKRTLADHRRIHTGEKPFKCPLCPAKFRQIPHCNRHLKTHQGNAYRPYDCDVCGKSFARKFGLALHQRDHAKQFPFKCNLCDKIFGVIEQLGDHFNRDHKL